MPIEDGGLLWKEGRKGSDDVMSGEEIQPDNA